MSMSMDSGDVSDDEFKGFCKGSSMTMSMGGFQSTLFSGGQADCITFLFVSFRLNSAEKFFCAMLCTFLLAVFCEGMDYCQTEVGNNCLLGKPKYVRKTIMALLYGFRQFLGWLLMLISMTFSIELFASAILGIVTGKLLFPVEIPLSRLIQHGSDIGGSDALDNNNEIIESLLIHQNQQMSDNSSELFPEQDESTRLLGNESSSSSAVRRRRH
mmetsp:Transcript_8954/g.17326  ORF Transcript_8954/g.17326 Transcript_8954/m.17326 type:complete len:214 (+) Transcript_8954:230-871(+)